ncbi:MAG TPA: PEP/pyruvate-binding domain-containing protein [Syntrophorhabdaceae bacterium]
MAFSMRGSTGLEGLDQVIDGLRIGDNVVWQVDRVEDYADFVAPFVQHATGEGKRVVYIRFARHDPLIPDDGTAAVYTLDATGGFESFSAEVNAIATREGQDVFYVFDFLSDLLSAWATDLMIGNFFMVTCPYLFQQNTIAYFGLLRSSHSFKTVARIRETTQVLLDLYSTGGAVYVHPLKVRGRHSATMFLPHKREGDRFVPVTSSGDATRLLTYISGREREQAKRNLDYWDRLFLDVEDLLARDGQEREKEEMLDRLCRIMVGRDTRILDLAKRNFTLEDLLHIKARLLGTGYLGGKSVGMLIARKILTRAMGDDGWAHLEPHDSFYVGSDLFYTYLIENGWWQLHTRQKTKEGYFEVAGTLRTLMREGSFPEEIEEQFWQLIEYFGQSPIIVRSSSLLEDAFGNAFAGKYESVFCVNQGTPEERYRAFRDAVRRVFASTMNEDALAYRVQRALDQQDEQMALLVQRVSGSHRKSYFFPDLAGVGLSRNTFVWKEGMDPEAGMVRLVLGLGTRAVNRVENDYPRVVALDAPLDRPLAGLGDIRRYSQHYVDLLNIGTNSLETVSLGEMVKAEAGISLDLFAVRDTEAAEYLKERGLKEGAPWILTFEALLSETSFPSVMQGILKRLEAAYGYPVDVEFTVNFGGQETEDFQINVVQCRPLQTWGEGRKVEIETDIPDDRILFASQGNFMGSSIVQPIRLIIYVEPEGYHKLSNSERYEIARIIGRLNRQIGAGRDSLPTLLMGPGRWGTTTPSLGIPVGFSEINNVSVLVEIEHETGSLTPELSFGTHFFQDLVETSIFYAAIFPRRKNAVFNPDWMAPLENRLASLAPGSERYEAILKVYEVSEGGLSLMADIISQKLLCFNPSKTDQQSGRTVSARV